MNRISLNRTVRAVGSLGIAASLALVCGVVLGGIRKSESWPTAIKYARSFVPRRPVVLTGTLNPKAYGAASSLSAM